MALTTVDTTALSGTITNAQLAGSIDLTAKVTGTLPTGNGGTGSTATTFVNMTSNVTGTLPAANGGTGVTSYAPGKVLQVVRGVLSTSTTVTGTTATEIMNTSITPAANANYIYAQLNVNYQMSCNDNTSNPYGNFRLKVGSTSGTTKADCSLRDINSAGATNVNRNYIGALSAYWTQDTTSAVAVYVTLEMGNSTGAIQAYGSNTATNATTLTLMEIEA